MMPPEAYARQLRQLLPPGRLWKIVASKLSKMFLGLADELSRIDGRGDDLINESDPSTADETISDWERVLGLPDDIITAIPGTLAERRIAAAQKFARIGGQRPVDFVALAALCGYVVTVARPIGVLRTGFRCGARCYGTVWAYTLTLTVSPPSGTALTHAELERVIRDAAHSHADVMFVYL